MPLPTQRKTVAALTTIYRPGAHADVIVGRLIQTESMDDRGRVSPLEVASLFTDQVPANDISRTLSSKYNIPIYNTIEEALTLGTGKLAVDGVLLVAEHGEYPKNDLGITQYPKRRLFEEVVKVFEKSGRVVPVYVDKLMGGNWADAKWIYDTAKRMSIPLMGGSSIPVSWRRPAIDVPRGAELREVLGTSFQVVDSYGFHGLENMQAIAERRKGGETGIVAVQQLTGAAVWEAGAKGVYDPKLLDEAMARVESPKDPEKPLAERVPEPSLVILEYADGLRGYMFTLNGAMAEWSGSWKYKDGRVESTLFAFQGAKPYLHFAFLMRGIEPFILTGKPTWPAERTLLTTGALDAAMMSIKEGGRRIETPHLNFAYKTDWTWQNPPPVSELVKA